MIKIHLKPLSLNQAYTGRRFATPKLSMYKKCLYKMLPKIKVPEGKLMARYYFGVSSSGGDGDNLIKAFQDALSEVYGFNDNKIYKWDVEKFIVKKGEEFIHFEVLPYEGSTYVPGL